MVTKSLVAGAIIHARPPSYLSCASLARELDVSENTVRDMVEKGILPKPLKLGGCVRWSWGDVQRSLGGVAAIGGATEEDAYMKGARNATAQG